MRRSSVITILVLVVIIVLLTIALIVTNLPKKSSDGVPNTQVEQNDNTKDEEPTYVSLDSDIIKKMYKTVSTNEVYANNYSRPTVLNDLENTDIVFTACMAANVFRSENLEKYRLADYEEVEYSTIENGIKRTTSFKSDVGIPKEEIEKAVADVFGSEYKVEHENLKHGKNTFGVYVEEKGKYYLAPDGGDGTKTSIDNHAIIEVKEYQDRYEVKEKYLLQEYAGEKDGVETYNIKVGPSESSKVLEEIGKNKTLENVIEGVNVKAMYSGDETISKLISKYYDETSEYVHTFMKNEDGTFYWVKTEKVK